MTSTIVPCRAADPATCKYHGAQRRAEAALLRGDFETWMQENTEMLRNRNIEEVRAFMNGDLPPADSISVLPTHDDPSGFEDRFRGATQAIGRDVFQPALGFPLGGHAAFTGGIKINNLHRAYTHAANAILDESVRSIDNDGPTDFLVAPHGPVVDSLRQWQNIALDDEDDELADAYDVAIKTIEDAQVRDAPHQLDSKKALHILDIAYLTRTNTVPVPAQPVSDFDGRFNDAFSGEYSQREKLRLYGLHPLGYKLNPYQQALQKATELVEGETRELDLDNNYSITAINTGGSRTLAQRFDFLQAMEEDGDAKRAYADARDTLSQAINIPGHADRVDAYRVLTRFEKLFGDAR